MAWQYCDKCEAAMDVPNFGEIVLGVQVCDGCDTNNDAMYSMRERIDKLNELANKVEKESE